MVGYNAIMLLIIRNDRHDGWRSLFCSRYYTIYCSPFPQLVLSTDKLVIVWQEWSEWRILNKTNKESSSWIVISTPIIESPVWRSSLRVDFVVCCVLITLSAVSVLSRSSLVLLSKRETLLMVQGHTICLTLLWMRSLSCSQTKKGNIKEWDKRQ